MEWFCSNFAQDDWFWDPRGIPPNRLNLPEGNVRFEKHAKYLILCRWIKRIVPVKEHNFPSTKRILAGNSLCNPKTLSWFSIFSMKNHVGNLSRPAGLAYKKIGSVIISIVRMNLEIQSIKTLLCSLRSVREDEVHENVVQEHEILEFRNPGCPKIPKPWIANAHEPEYPEFRILFVTNSLSLGDSDIRSWTQLRGFSLHEPESYGDISNQGRISRVASLELSPGRQTRNGIRQPRK